MTSTEIIRELMEGHCYTYGILAEELGDTSKGAMHKMINGRRTSMRLDSFLRIMDALDACVVIRDSSGIEFELEGGN